MFEKGLRVYAQATQKQHQFVPKHSSSRNNNNKIKLNKKEKDEIEWRKPPENSIINLKHLTYKSNFFLFTK